jgi:hypothetical protein
MNSIIMSTITLITYVLFPPHKLKHNSHMSKKKKKTYELPKDGQQLWPKHVGALINKYKTLCNKLALNFT